MSEERRMDDKRMITREQFFKALNREILADNVYFDSLPDAPKHTDEEYDDLVRHFRSIIKHYDDRGDEIDTLNKINARLQDRVDVLQARIKSRNWNQP